MAALCDLKMQIISSDWQAEQSFQGLARQYRTESVSEYPQWSACAQNPTDANPTVLSAAVSKVSAFRIQAAQDLL